MFFSRRDLRLDVWKFAERVYEVRYLDTTPLAGSAPPRGTRGLAQDERRP
jgi:hypothetical protein